MITAFYSFSLISLLFSSPNSKNDSAIALIGHHYIVEALSFSPCGKYLATIDSEIDPGSIWIWSVKEKKVLSKLDCYQFKFSLSNLGYTPDGNMIFANDYYNFGIWEVKSSKLVKKLAVKPNVLYSVVPCPDGKSIAIAIDRSVVCLSLNDLELKKNKKDYAAIPGAISVFSFSSDAKKLFFSKDDGSDSSAIVDYVTGKEIKELKKKSQWVAKFSFFVGNDKEIVTGGYLDKVTIWDSQTGEAKHSYSVDGSNVTSISYSKKNEVMIAGTEKGTLWGLNVVTREHKVIIKGDPIACVAISPDGSKLAVSYGDGKLSSRDRINQGIVHLMDTDKTKLRYCPDFALLQERF